MAKTGLLDEIDTKLVSVIIPIYNVEKYLDRCVQSVVKQTYKNLEIILVDDGSPDNCPELCDEWKKADSRIKVIHKKNGGLSDARNAGRDIATGEYIAFVDSDDYVHPQYIEILYCLAIREDADVVACGFETFTDNYKTEQNIYHHLTDVEVKVSAKDEMDLIGIVAWNKLYRRNLFDFIRFPKGRINEDMGIFWKIIYYAKKMIATVEPLYFYYIANANSIMSQPYSIKRFDIVEVQFEQYIFFKDKKIHDYANSILKACLDTYPREYVKLEKNHKPTREEKRKIKKSYFRSLKEAIFRKKINVSFKIKHCLYFGCFPLMSKIYRKKYGQTL